MARVDNRRIEGFLFGGGRFKMEDNIKYSCFVTHWRTCEILGDFYRCDICGYDEIRPDHVYCPSCGGKIMNKMNGRKGE